MILMGYFMVWLPHEAAGLSYIGLEMGEQAKFLPQVRSGEILPGRSLFYVPPVSVGLILVFLSSQWPLERWHTWVARSLGPLISTLALPALEAVGAEPAEWLWRVIMIGLVFALALLSPLLSRMPNRFLWLLIVATAFFGALLPGWVFLEVQAGFAALQRQPIGIGAGVWINVGGHILAAAVALAELRE